MSQPLHRDQALRDLDDLERLANTRLGDAPVYAVDQWGAGVRDAFRDLDAVLENRDAARAAFAGAYITASIAAQGALLRPDSLATITHLLRWLYERGEDELRDGEIEWPTD